MKLSWGTCTHGSYSHCLYYLKWITFLKNNSTVSGHSEAETHKNWNASPKVNIAKLLKGETPPPNPYPPNHGLATVYDTGTSIWHHCSWHLVVCTAPFNFVIKNKWACLKVHYQCMLDLYKSL